MEEVNLKVTIYDYDELPKEIQNIILNGWCEYYLECDGWDEDSFVTKAIKKAERMKTPWFVKEYMFEYGMEHILSDARSVKYFKNGNIYNNEK